MSDYFDNLVDDAATTVEAPKQNSEAPEANINPEPAPAVDTNLQQEQLDLAQIPSVLVRHH